MHTVLTCIITWLKVLLKVLVLIIAILFTNIVNNPGGINSSKTTWAKDFKFSMRLCAWVMPSGRTNNFPWKWVWPRSRDLYNFTAYDRKYALDYLSFVYSVSQKIPPPEVIWFFSFFHKRLRIFDRFFTHLLHVPITLDDKFLFNYHQLWRSYAILSATT